MHATREVATNAIHTVEATLDAFCDAWNLHDMDAMARLFCSDADFVNVVGMHFHGSNEILTAHRYLHQDRFAHTQVKRLQHSVSYLSDDIAWAYMRWEMTGDRAAAPDCVRRGTMTHVLVRRNGEWLFRATQNTDIVHVPALAGHPFWSKYL